MPISFRACLTAIAHFLRGLVAKAFFEAWETFFETILPSLFFMSFSLVRPPAVLSLRPKNTMALARKPFAILLFFIAAAFMAFFITAFLITAFLITAFFITAFFFMLRTMADLLGWRAVELGR